MIIRIGKVEEILELRHEILRAGLPRQLAHFDGDDEPTTRHFVVELGGAIVGCATLLQRPWNGQPAWQLRGMAVAKQLQRSGIGVKLLTAIEQLARDSGFSNQLWCNARVSAATFYQSHGWQIASDQFMVEHAGLHFKMQKRLEPQINTDKHRYENPTLC